MKFPYRSFSLHLYWVSHGLLLLRSGISNTHPTRIDVLFRDVLWLSLPAFMHGLAIEQTALVEVLSQLPPSMHEEAELRRVYRLTIEGKSHFVVAGTIDVAEDQRTYFEESALLPQISMPNLRE
jgi:hypothetical protein